MPSKSIIYSSMLKQFYPISLFASLVFALLCSSSCSTSKVGVQQGSSVAQNQLEDNSLLYKVEGQGIQPSYLFGTIHVLPQKDFVLKEKVKTAFNASELIVLELDMDDPGMQVEMMQNALMSNGQTLDKLFDAEHYKKLDDALKETLGMGVAPFNSMKPFVVSSMLLMRYLGEQPASFEGSFIQMAQAGNKEILGLETVADQMQVFDDIPYEEQVDDIEEMLDNPTDASEGFALMVDTYKKEDIGALYEMMADQMESELQMELLLHKRNRDWIPKITEFAKTQSTFFGVGAGHLGGEQGVVTLLRKAGYQVTPITG